MVQIVADESRMQVLLRCAIARCVDRNRAAVGLMQALAEGYPAEFQRVALQVLGESECSRGAYMLGVVFLSLPGYLDGLLSDEFARSPNAARAFRQLLRAEPALDMDLARRLPDRNGRNRGVSSEQAERL